MSALRVVLARAGVAVRAHPGFWALALLLVAGQAALRWWALSQAYFFQDDFVYTHLARTLPLVDFVTLDYRGHLQPGQFALMAVLARLAPLDWTVHAAVLLALQLVFDAVLLALLVRMFGARSAVLVPFAVVLFSPLSAPPLLWFAAALQWLPLALATVVLLLSHLHLGDATGRSRRRWRLVAAVAFLLALASWERALSLVGVLALAEVTWFARTRGRDRFTAPLRRDPLLWAWYLLLTVAYLVVYAAVSVGTPTALPSGSDTLALLRETAGTLAPGLLGAPWGVQDGAETLMRPPDQPLPWVVAQLAIVVGALLLTAGPRRLVRAWTVPVALLALDVVVMVVTRLSIFGLDVGRDPRFFVDVVPLAAIALGVTFLKVAPVEAKGSRADESTSVANTWCKPPPWQRWPRPVRHILLLLVMGWIVNSGWISTATIGRAHQDDPARKWVESTRASLRELPVGAAVRDTPVPADVMTPLFGPQRMLSSVLGSLPEAEDRIDVVTNDLRVVDASGELVPVSIDPRVRSRPGPVPGCGYAIRGARTVIPLAEEVGTGWLVRIDYYAATTAPARVDIGDERTDVQFADGVGAIHLFPNVTATEVVISGVDADRPICVVDVVVAPSAGP